MALAAVSVDGIDALVFFAFDPTTTNVFVTRSMYRGTTFTGTHGWRTKAEQQIRDQHLAALAEQVDYQQVAIAHLKKRGIQ